MTSITTRAGKGTPLTHTEVDDNFTNLNADKLEASNNLSDVSSASAARTNLGLGTAATTASTDYATAAQGSLADSAVQTGDNVSALTNDAGYTTNVGDITGVTAGSGITGGGTSGAVTISHENTSSQGSVNNSGSSVIQDVTLDTYGHVTGLTSKTISVPSTSVNTVGTYALLVRSGVNQDVSVGSTYAGSGLIYMGVIAYPSRTSYGYYSNRSGSPSGTWRAMGYCNGNPASSTGGFYQGTVFVRIS